MTDISQKDYELLQRAAEFEKTMSEDEFNLGWRWYEVQAHTGSINKLVVKGLAKISFKSHSETRYRLTDTGKAVTDVKFPEGTSVLGEEVEVVPVVPLDVENMFNDIVGYDDIKELLRESLQLDKPIHTLLIGPPALAKSMFLWDIERAYGEYTMPLLGSATSHAGLWDLVAEKQPRIILVDEIEKMSITDQAALLSLMQTGRIIRAKVGRKLDVQITVWVIAAANRISRMPAELLSRFATCELQEYDALEFGQVVTNVLESYEEIEHNTAAEIATRLVGKTHDVRDAIRVGRLSKAVGVKRAVELLIR